MLNDVKSAFIRGRMYLVADFAGAAALMVLLYAGLHLPGVV